MRDGNPGGAVTVRLEHISVTRKTGDIGAKNLLEDVSFSARSGAITAVIGPSGGGKSTLIRLVNRLTEPDSGGIFFAGNNIASLDPLQLRRTVALVPQKPFMFEGTVLDNLQLPFNYRQKTPPDAGSKEVLHALSLSRLDEELLQRDARTLSVGQQQRVSLARALVTAPEVLLLDEPTSALDRRTADELAGTLQDICRMQGLTLIMVTHDLRLVRRIADYCIYLEAGRILEEGAAEDLLEWPKSEELRRFLSEPSAKEG